MLKNQVSAGKRSTESRRPKLLVVHPASDIGGAEICTRDLLIHQRDFEAVLLTQSAIGSCFTQAPVKNYWFDDFGCHAPYALNPANIWRYAGAIASVMRMENPDLVLGVTHTGMVYITVANERSWARASIFSVIPANFSGYFNTMVRRPPSFSEKLLMRYCFWRSTGVIAPSVGVRDDLVANFHANPRKVRAIFNGMDLVKIRSQALEPTQIPKDKPWIVTSCRLSPPKDVDTLIRAFRQVRSVRQVRLLVLGEGELRPQIETLIAELNLTEDVWLPGFLPNPFPYVAQADVFVLSSLSEGFGNVIVEAMALGVAVVASDCPCGPGEIIEHGISGFLVPVMDEIALASILGNLLDHETLRREIGANALCRSEAFGVEAMAAGYGDYLMNAIRAH